jgi:hypothetical protein
VDGILFGVWAGWIYIVRLIVIDYFSITCMCLGMEGCLGIRGCGKNASRTTKWEKEKCAIGTMKFHSGNVRQTETPWFKVCVGRDWHTRVLIGGQITGEGPTREQRPEKWTGMHTGQGGRNLRLELDSRNLKVGIIEYVESILSIAINYTRYTIQTIFFPDGKRTIGIQNIHNVASLQRLSPSTWVGIIDMSLQNVSGYGIT